MTPLSHESLGYAMGYAEGAVGIAVGEDHFSVPHVSWLFLLVRGRRAGGALAAWLGVLARRRVADPLAATRT
ncbi:hypothetical protein [Streptomyces sp. NPDC055134]